jgi:hypothetical protein
MGNDYFSEIKKMTGSSQSSHPSAIAGPQMDTEGRVILEAVSLYEKEDN